MLAANLCASGVNVDDEALHLFLEVDDDIATSAPPTDDGIIQKVQSSSETKEEEEDEEEEEEEEEETTVPPPSFAQATESLCLLCRFMVSLPHPVHHHNSHWEELASMETDFEKSHHSLLKQKKHQVLFLQMAVIVSDFFPC